MVDLFVDSPEKLKICMTPPMASQHEETRPAWARGVIVPCRCCKVTAKCGQPFCSYHWKVESYAYARLNAKQAAAAGRLYDSNFPLYCWAVKQMEDKYDAWMLNRRKLRKIR